MFSGLRLLRAFQSIIALRTLAISARPIETADMTPIAHGGLPPLGVNTFFEQEVDEITIRRSMEMIRAAGFAWIRQQFVWREIERPAKDAEDGEVKATCTLSIFYQDAAASAGGSVAGATGRESGGGR